MMSGVIGSVAPGAASAADTWTSRRVPVGHSRSHAPSPIASQDPHLSAAPTAGPSSPSVMIQLSTLSAVATPADLRAWMQRICPSGVVPAGQLALQDVATGDGTLLTDYLDVLAPYLPGVAAHPCFARVYVGTLEPVWSRPGTPYVDGVQNPAFVADYVSRSSAVAAAFAKRYSRVTIDWYITYEANLNDLYYPQVAAAYQNLLSGELKSFAAVRRNRHVMWSPAFWYPYSAYHTNTLGMAGLTTSLTTLFSALSTIGRGIDVVDLQDYVAGSSCQPSWNQVTPSDAVGWVAFLRGLGVIPEVDVNTERYAVDCPTRGIVNCDPTEVLAREAFYRSRGLTLGPAFELRYWVHNHL